MKAQERVQVARALRAAATALVGPCPECGAERGVNIDCPTCVAAPPDERTTAAALRAAAYALTAAKQKLRVFDCDETLLVSDGVITVKKATGETISMDSSTFAHFKPVEGDTIDFTAFNHVRKPRKIKGTFEKFKKAVADGDKVVILTARAKGAESAIKKFLQHEGIEPAKVEVVGLGSSNPYDKARWIDKAITDGGFDDVEFYDDSHANAAAVAEHGKKHHSKIKFTATNVAHPNEADFEGPALDLRFDSDEPVESVVKYTKKSLKEGSGHKPHEHHEPSDWWDRQTKTFHEKYCKEHPHSNYC